MTDKNLKEQIQIEKDLDFSEFLPDARAAYFEALNSKSAELPMKTFVLGMYLVKSKDRTQIKGGVDLLEKLASEAASAPTVDTGFLRDCYYFAALGRYYLEEREAGREDVKHLLKVTPGHPQGQALLELLKEPDHTEEIAVGVMVASVVAVGAATLIALLARR